MRERLLNMGWSKARVDMEIERERIKRTQTTTTTTWASGNALVPFLPGDRAPTYAKVKKEHIAIETLKYYGIPWEYDRVSFSSCNGMSRPQLTSTTEGQAIHHNPPRDD